METLSMCPPGGVTGGEGDRVPAESGGGEAPGGGLALLPAPSDRELQTAVDERPSSGLLHRQTQRWGERSALPFWPMLPVFSHRKYFVPDMACRDFFILPTVSSIGTTKFFFKWSQISVLGFKGKCHSYLATRCHGNAARVLCAFHCHLCCAQQWFWRRGLVKMP